MWRGLAVAVLLAGLGAGGCKRSESQPPAPDLSARTSPSASARPPAPVLAMSAAPPPTGVPSAPSAWPKLQQRWRYEATPATRSPMLHEAGLVITASGEDDQGSEIVALELRTGKPRWRRPIATTQLALVGDRVLAFGPERQLVALDARTGDDHFRLDGMCKPLRVLSSGDLAVVDCVEADDGLIGIDVAKGRQLWMVNEIGTRGGWWELGIAVVKDSVYAARIAADWAAGANGRLRRIDGRSGKTLWAIEVEGPSCVVRATQDVVIAIQEKVWGYRAADGKLLWAYRLPEVDASRGYQRWRDVPVVAQGQLLLPHGDRVLLLEPQTGQVSRQWVLPALAVARRQVTVVDWDGSRLLAWVGDHVAGKTSAIATWRATGWQVVQGSSSAAGMHSLLAQDQLITTQLGDRHWGLSAYALPAPGR